MQADDVCSQYRIAGGQASTVAPARAGVPASSNEMMPQGAARVLKGPRISLKCTETASTLM